MKEIKKVLNELVEKATELSALLETFEKEIGDICAKPLKEMGVSEKIKLAKFIITTTERFAEQEDR